jgi:hypothetical protein
MQHVAKNKTECDNNVYNISFRFTILHEINNPIEIRLEKKIVEIG